MSKVHVGVLRGGPSPEYDISLKTGASVLQHLNEEEYAPRDIFISRDGIWHTRGMPVETGRALGQVDVVFNALHGKYGEDGEVQRILDAYKVPYTGSGAVASSIAMHKVLTKKTLVPYGVNVPRHTTIGVSDDIGERVYDYFRTHAQPTVVKPPNAGSSVGVAIAGSYEELMNAVRDAFNHSKDVLLEEYIRGREATCGVVEDFRGEELYALPPIEIIPPKGHGFFDYDAKYSGETQEICPGGFSYAEKEALKQIAKTVHLALGLRHYSRSDFIVTPKSIYFLEVNTLPGLTKESLVPKAFRAVGCSFPDCLDHLIGLALR